MLSALGVVWFIADGGAGDAGTSQAALYSMISALGVALLAGGFSIATAHFSTSRGRTSSGRRRRRGEDLEEQSEAWERWIILHHPDVDPRKIKTGYESTEKVRRAV